MTCVEARARLQDLHDAGGAPAGELAAHLEGCDPCSRFWRFLAALGAETRDVLDAAAADLPRPDYPAIVSRTAEAREKAAFPARRFRLVFMTAAAVLVAAGGISAGVSAYVGSRERNRVADQVGSFVDELFAEPLLADAGFPVDGQASGFRDWLEDPEPSFLP
jgi:hypothetical protein